MVQIERPLHHWKDECLGELIQLTTDLNEINDTLKSDAEYVTRIMHNRDVLQQTLLIISEEMRLRNL